MDTEAGWHLLLVVIGVALMYGGSAIGGSLIHLPSWFAAPVFFGTIGVGFLVGLIGILRLAY